MTSLSMKRYSLNYFKERENILKGSDQLITDETLKIINSLAHLVGAPEYQKTPVFKKDDKTRKRQTTKTTSVEDWENMRNFKTTTLVKSEDKIDKSIDEIRTLLNKITSKNYDEMHKNVIELLKTILTSSPEEEELIKIGTSIFEIGSMNKFWSRLYAQLLKDIIEIFPIMKTIYDKNFDNSIKLFDEIRYISAEENYDKFCLVNKENEKRRSLSSFFVHLMNNGLLSVDTVGDIIIKLVNKFENVMDDGDKKIIVSELGENICIFMKEGGENLQKEYKNIEKVNKFLEYVSETSHKVHPGLSSKVIFKFIDLLEEP